MHIDELVMHIDEMAMHIDELVMQSNTNAITGVDLPSG